MKLPAQCGKCFRRPKGSNPLIQINESGARRCWICVRQQELAKRLPRVAS